MTLRQMEAQPLHPKSPCTLRGQFALCPSLTLQATWALPSKKKACCPVCWVWRAALIFWMTFTWLIFETFGSLFNIKVEILVIEMFNYCSDILFFELKFIS